MCKPRRFGSQVQRQRAIVGLLATLVALLTCGVAVADTVTTNFETFQPGSVNGQQGWKSAPLGALPSCAPIGGHYDQAVVANSGAPAAFDLQSLRISNLCGDGEFLYQTYSAPVASPAGETLTNTEYTAEFSFISKTPGAEQPGLFVSVSPDSYEGSRMSYVSLRDTPDGIQASVSDTPEVDGDFMSHDAGLLKRDVPHTIKFWIKVNPGPDNDLVRVYVDGADLGQCFATWENYYRTSPEQSPPPNVNNPATISSLQFRTSVQGPPELGATGGYLFDNVSITTANGAGPPGCDTVIDKKADTRTVSAGGREGYQITVRNRGSAVDRNLMACDHIPQGTTFIGADRKLSRLGRARCLPIPRLGPGQSVRFHLDLRVAPNAPPGTLTNIADLTPREDRPDSATLPGADLQGPPAAPGGPPAELQRNLPARKAKALVRVVRKRIAARRGRQPRFTG